MLLLFVVNQIILSIMFGKLLVFLGKTLGLDPVEVIIPENIPSFERNITELLFHNLVQEISSYYTHRTLHKKFFYKRFHKIHHEFSFPQPISALYNHPLEHVMKNMIPSFLGLMLINAHLSTFLLWIVINIFTTIGEHSNYHIPLFNSPRFHNYHHETSIGNFGLTGVMDFIYGTDKHFRASKSFPKNQIIWPFVGAPMDKLKSS